LETAERERDTERTRGRQLGGELRSLQAELESERVRLEESERDRDALAAEVAEARSAPATAPELASRDSESAGPNRAREEQRRAVETLAVVLDEIRRDRDTVREEHSEVEGQVAALEARIAELEQERDEHARALVEAKEATEAALGSATDERGKLAQLVKKLGDEQAARKRLLAEASDLADRERRRAEAAEEAARQIEQEREQRDNLLPRLETLQREVAASEQRLATAAIQVLGERRRQDEERRRAEAAEAAARRYKHRLSELEQSGTVPA
jgi:colicin import membrane protein